MAFSEGFQLLIFLLNLAGERVRRGVMRWPPRCDIAGSETGGPVQRVEQSGRSGRGGCGARLFGRALEMRSGRAKGVRRGRVPLLVLVKRVIKRGGRAVPMVRAMIRTTAGKWV
jgi:hypothetical protein